MDQWIREHYKSKGAFGTTNLETRRSATATNRKEQRNTLLRKFRNIPETMSPLMSPMVPKAREEKETVSKKAAVDTKSKRLMMLKKWKEEKERKKAEEKKKTKPLFKVFHVEHKENLEDVYKNIKGKTINSKGKAAMTPIVPKKSSQNAAMTLRTNNSRAIKPESTKNQRSVPSKNHQVGRKTPENPKKSARGQSKVEKNVAISKPVRGLKLDLKEEPKNVNQSSNVKPNSPSPRKQNKLKSPGKNEINIDTTDNKNKSISKGRSRRKNEDDPNIGSETDGQNNIENLLEINKEEIEQKTPRRSRRKAVNDDEEKEETVPSKSSNKKNKRDKTPSQSSRSRQSLGSSSAEKSMEDDVFATPKKASVDEICYVSPFVTVSRGKAAARKEFEQRKSLNGSVLNTSISGSADPRSPRAAADYFTRILNNEISRIQGLCKTWQSYKDEANLSEDACGLIDMTIGQSNLLVTKKFNQFRGLIEKCKTNDEFDVKVQCEDLHGFWDMMYKQVTDLDKRFDNLEDMKKNNWLEEAPKVKTPKVAVKTKKRGRAKSTKASSGLKETISAARKFRMKQIKSEGDVEILIAGKKGTPRRISKNIKEVGTPGRGILKSANVKSEKRKTVVFHNLIENLGDNGNSPQVFKGTPIPSRRSERLSLNRSKLVFDE